MDIKVKTSLMFGEKLNNCSNLTLFFINDGKVIGTSYFYKMGCNINVVNYESRNKDFALMIENGLYEIFGSLNNLKLVNLCETSIIDSKLLPKVKDYVRNHKIHCEQYEEDITDKVERNLRR